MTTRVLIVLAIAFIGVGCSPKVSSNTAADASVSNQLSNQEGAVTQPTIEKNVIDKDAGGAKAIELLPTR